MLTKKESIRSLKIEDRIIEVIGEDDARDAIEIAEKAFALCRKIVEELED